MNLSIFVTMYTLHNDLIMRSSFAHAQSETKWITVLRKQLRMSVKEGNKLDTYRTFSGVSAKVFPGMYVILLCIIILINKEIIFWRTGFFIFFLLIIIIPLCCLSYKQFLSHAKRLLCNNDCYVTMQDTWQASLWRCQIFSALTPTPLTFCLG